MVDINKHLDTNVMYDTASGEGLVCVNGRCISNKRKMRMHNEYEMGFNGTNPNRKGGRKGPPSRRKKIRRPG